MKNLAVSNWVSSLLRYRAVGGGCALLRSVLVMRHWRLGPLPAPAEIKGIVYGKAGKKICVEGSGKNEKV